MKKILPIVLVFSLLSGGLCLRLFGSDMAMGMTMNQSAGQTLMLNTQQISCCAGVQRGAQKVAVSLAPAQKQIRGAILASVILIFAFAALRFWDSASILSLRRRNAMLITAGPPSLTGSIIKRE